MNSIKAIDEALFIELDDDNANITISGVPVIVMSKSTFGSLHKGILDALGKGARPMFYTSGYDAGKNSAPVVIRQWECETTDEIISATTQQFARYGWLILRDIELSGNQREITCTVIKSVEAMTHTGKSDTPVCYFLEGFMCGYMEVVFNMEDMVCEEVSCQAMGNDVCRFVIKPKFWEE